MKMSGIVIVIAFAVLLLVQAASADVGLSVSLAKYDPYPASPGQTVHVWLLVQNTGTSDAKNVVLTLVPESPFSLYNQQNNTITIPILGAQKDYLVDFTLKVSNSAVQGANYLRVDYNSNNTNYLQESKLEVDVQVRDNTLSIDNITLDPAAISPGGDGKLTITVKNTAPIAFSDVELSLALQSIVGTNIIDLPFAPIGSGTEKKIALLNPGDEANFTYNLKAYPGATSQVYKIPFLISYYDNQGNQLNQSDIAGVIVNSVPEVTAMIDSTDISTSKLAGTLTIKVVNKGLSDIKFLTVIVGSSPDFDMLTESRTNYVGNLVSDDYQTIDYTLNVHPGKGSVTIPVTLQYMDSNNNLYNITKDINLSVDDTSKIQAANGSGGSPIIFILIVIVVIVAAVIFFRRRAKKNKKGQF